MHRIDDLGRPRLPLALRTLNALGRPLVGGIRLDVEALLESARRRAGLDDFGDASFREPLGVLVDAIEAEGNLSRREDRADTPRSGARDRVALHDDQYSRRLQCARVEPGVIGRYWADRVADLLRGSVEQCALVPKDQVFDVQYPELMADNMAMVERIYDFAGQPWTEPARESVRSYMAAHRPGRFGRIDYRLEDFALDAAERRRALRFYQERFGVPDE